LAERIGLNHKIIRLYDEGAMDELEEFKIPEEAVEKLQDPEVLQEHLAEGRTFQEILEYSDETMEKFYHAAYNLFQNGLYHEAADAFVFLTTLNPYVHNFWLGLGMSEQRNEDYEAALVAYGMATMTDMDSPVPHYHSGHCYYLMGEYDTSVSVLDITIELCADAEEHASLKKDALTAKERVQKRLESS